MIPMAQQIEKLADTYRPEQLQQKYKMTQELMYLLALQQVQSEPNVLKQHLWQANKPNRVLLKNS